jgi:hypothetical protein
MRRIAFGLALVGLLGLVLPACAGDGSSGASAESESAAARPPQGVPPPPGHPLAKVHEGMAPGQVAEVMGAPTSETSYQTGKAWIPFYWGSDLSRTDWKYKGQGRVVFSHNRWSGSQKVIRIDYDPAEDGR